MLHCTATIEFVVWWSGLGQNYFCCFSCSQRSQNSITAQWFNMLSKPSNLNHWIAVHKIETSHSYRICTKLAVTTYSQNSQLPHIHKTRSYHICTKLAVTTYAQLAVITLCTKLTITTYAQNSQLSHMHKTCSYHICTKLAITT